MGYSTDFDGEFTIVDLETGKPKELSDDERDYLFAFSETRHLERDTEVLQNRYNRFRKAVGLPLGRAGEYYTDGGRDYHGDPSVLDINKHPSTQPGLWCQWVPDKSGAHIRWDGGEKFYHYVEWLEYILENFLVPWGYGLEGCVRWRGEEFDDIGTLGIEGKTKVTAARGAF